jgi:hypothetical protein
VISFDTRVARLYALKFPSHLAASRAWWCGKAGPDKPSRKGRTRRRTQQHKEPWQAGDQLGQGSLPTAGARLAALTLDRALTPDQRIAVFQQTGPYP